MVAKTEYRLSGAPKPWRPHITSLRRWYRWTLRKEDFPEGLAKIGKNKIVAASVLMWDHFAWADARFARELEIAGIDSYDFVVGAIQSGDVSVPSSVRYMIERRYRKPTGRRRFNPPPDVLEEHGQLNLFNQPTMEVIHVRPESPIGSIAA